MPYELSFTKRIRPTDREQYINECCVGGDVVVTQLLPAVRKRYADVDTNQEDWGWFIWFRQGPVRLAIDVFTDNPDEGHFRIHLTSRTKRLLVLDTIADTPELESLRSLVVDELERWTQSPVRVVRLDPSSMESHEG